MPLLQTVFLDPMVFGMAFKPNYKKVLKYLQVKLFDFY